MAHDQSKDHWADDDNCISSYDVTKEWRHDDRAELLEIAARLRVDASDYQQEHHGPGKKTGSYSKST
ncbi:hypothetical protein [Rhizobium mongolense]|uniref:DUF3606 domain-containing protein n=1 Tax=Rhizobium mongolense TaxID=57676 RepID=A0ABR6IPY8_9HYPH|nr:hypothetical protein [Rhizobium mongolense]MBB4229855.1 hypothetical protein [Rhizobium mongolense]